MLQSEKERTMSNHQTLYIWKMKNDTTQYYVLHGKYKILCPYYEVNLNIRFISRGERFCCMYSGMLENMVHLNERKSRASPNYCR